MPKIYLSPAVHEHDRQCVFDAKCSENTHANLYLDELVAYLNAVSYTHLTLPTSDLV